MDEQFKRARLSYENMEPKFPEPKTIDGYVIMTIIVEVPFVLARSEDEGRRLAEQMLREKIAGFWVDTLETTIIVE